MSTTRRTVAGLAATITTHPLASTMARVLLLVALSMVMLSVLLLSTGHDVVAALSAMVRGAFGSYYAITSATIVRLVPLALAGLAVSVAFRAGLLNIGAEGQLLMGAAAATALSGALGGVPWFLGIPAILVAGALAGGAWAAICSGNLSEADPRRTR